MEIAVVNGYVYVLTNKHVPKLVKIGYTDRSPHTRARELSQVTGVPGEWLVFHSWSVSSAHIWEQKIFSALSTTRESGEFFRLKPSDAVEKINAFLASWGEVDINGLSRNEREIAENFRINRSSKNALTDWNSIKEVKWKEATYQAEIKYGKTLIAINEAGKGFINLIFYGDKIKKLDRQRNELFNIRNNIFIEIRREHFTKGRIPYPFNDSEPI